MRAITLSGLLFVLVVISAGAATIHVPGDFDSIQEAADAANPGDEIVVDEAASDIYPWWSPPLIITKDLTLTGIGDVRIGQLEIRAADVRIRGFHLTQFGAGREPDEPHPYGSVAVWVVGEARLVMEDCLIRHRGLGIDVTAGGARVELYRCRLEEITSPIARVGHGSSLHAEACLFQSSFGDGIVAYGAARVTGTGNTVSVSGVPFAGDVAPGFVEPAFPATEASVLYPSEPYASLQEAVDAVRPGGELILAGGVHAGSVRVGKEMTIRAAADGEATVLQVEWFEDLSSRLAPTILVTSGGDLCVEGIDVIGPTAILVAGTGTVEIVDSVIRGQWYGLVVQSEAEAAVQSCQFLGARLAGIVLLGRSSAWVEESTLDLGMIGILLSGVDKAYGSYGPLAPGANRLELSDVRLVVGEEPSATTVGLLVVCAEVGELTWEQPLLALAIGYTGIYGGGPRLFAAPLAESSDRISGDVRIDPLIVFPVLPDVSDWWETLLVAPWDGTAD